MDAITESKVMAVLEREFSLYQADALLDLINNEDARRGDVNYMLERIKLLNKTDDGEEPVEGYFCPHCGKPLYAEHDLTIDYMFVCPECDENFYSFEAIKEKN